MGAANAAQYGLRLVELAARHGGEVEKEVGSVVGDRRALGERLAAPEIEGLHDTEVLVVELDVDR